MERKTQRIGPQKQRFGIGLFSLSFLVFQAILLIFEIFHIDSIEAVISMRKFMRDSSLFLSLLFLLLLGYYVFATLSTKKQQRVWNYTLINSGSCALNIILLNEWYHSDKLKSALTSLLEKPIFVILAIFALIILTVIALNKAKGVDPNINQPPRPENVQPVSEGSTPIPDPPQPQNKSTIDENVSKSKGRLVFLIILSIMAFGIGLLVYFLISKYNSIAPILSDQDTFSRYLTYALLIIIGIAAVIILVIVITYVTQYVCKTLLSLPKFLEGEKQPDPRIVKVAFGVTGVPVFFGLTKLFKINMDWLLNLLHKQDYLVIPFTILLYFVLSLLLVEILYDLFSAKSDKRWVRKFKTIIITSGNSIMEICDGIIGSFLNLLKFPPDFLFTIEDLLLDIKPATPDDETGHAPTGDDANKEKEGEEPV